MLDSYRFPWSRTDNHMLKTLLPVLLCALMLISACGGSSGVGNPPAPRAEVDSPDASETDLPGDNELPQALPPAPLNLRASRYSATAAEIFWDQPADTSGDALRYVVRLAGNEIARVSALSFFTESLQAGGEPTMSVSTLDSHGQVSRPASVRIHAEIDLPPPVHDFELWLESSNVTLTEGRDPGAVVIIKVIPQGEEAISLLVQGQSPGDAADLVMQLDRDLLQGEYLSAELTLQMPLGMRPILPQQRRFTVMASSGEEVRTAELVVDIDPVAAPDVYLLIGQSNMVGSSETGAKEVWSGGLDERNERIWQLNVAPNNTQIFSGLADFQDESTTLIEPHFIEAEDPLHDPRNPVVAYKGGTTIGPGLSFAKAALGDTTQPIYLVPAAWGASGFCRVASHELAWNAGSSDNASMGGTGLLERALTRLRITLRETGGVLRGILWHQGGADSNDQACADAYADNLKMMVERIRREAAPDIRGEAFRGSQAPIPFIAATQSRGADERGDYSLWASTKYQVDAVHRGIDSLLPYADWVNNDDLVPPGYPCGSSSCVHFGASASRETGRRYYQALKRIWQR